TAGGGVARVRGVVRPRPAVGVLARDRGAQTQRAVDPIEVPGLVRAARAVLMRSDELPVDVDSLLCDDIREMWVVRERAVRLSKTRGRRRAGPGRRPVEAPHALPRPFEDLERVLAVRILDLLADVERRLAAGEVVEPRRVPADVLEEGARERIRRARRR